MRSLAEFEPARRHLSSSHSTAGVARQAGAGTSSAASGSGGLSHSLSSGFQVRRPVSLCKSNLPLATMATLNHLHVLSPSSGVYDVNIDDRVHTDPQPRSF